MTEEQQGYRPRAEESSADLHDERVAVAHEERLDVGSEVRDVGSVKVRKHVETYPVEEVVPRSIEHADTSERMPADEDDSGEVLTLEDGSVSIPVFEEVLVVTKRLVVRERVIVRKQTVIDEYTLQTELRREHVTVEADGDVDLAQSPAAADLDGTTTIATADVVDDGTPPGERHR